MKRLSKKTRLMLSIVILLICAVLSWGLTDCLGDLSLMFMFPAGLSFVLLNPELMKGE